MPADKYYADIHCHTTVPPYNQGKCVWHSKPPRPRQRRKGNFLRDNIARPYTQSDLVSLFKGKVRVAFVSLYPVEWNFMTITRKPVLDEGFFKAIWEIITCTVRAIIQFLGMYTFLGRILSTYPPCRIRRILEYDHEYYDDLCKEYDFLKDDPTCPEHIADKHGIPHDTAKQIVNNYAELRSVLDDPTKVNTIAVIVTIEGCHVLGSGQKNTLDGLPDQELNDFTNPKTKALRDKLIENIGKMKSWPHPPFFVSLDHHFWNQLAGQAMSLGDKLHVLFDQRRGINTDENELGKIMIRELLSASNGRRILVDTKHMSIDTREWFYGLLKQHNQGKPAEKKVPVVASHMGVNAIGTMDASRNCNDHYKEDERYALNDSTFNPWDINLSDEEIRIIHDSGGLIGLILDQRVPAGKMVNDFLNNLPCEVRKDEKLAREKWVKPLLNNILHVARVVLRHTSDPGVIWNSIVIGSDFDGRIDPLDPFCSSADFPNLAETLVARMRKMRDDGSEELLAGKTDAQISQIVEKIMVRNVEDFLSVFFTDSYLNDPLDVDSIFV